MRAALRSGLIVAAVVSSCAACVSGSAQAQPAFARLRDQATAWRQIEPLLRERARPKASGFDFEPTFKLKTASGYTVRVAALGNTVAVLLGNGHGDVSAYLARGVATSRRLRASYGSFGSLDMRFHPSPAATPKPARRHGCHGRRRHPELRGTWVGTLRFESEGHRISVRAHRALGGIRRQAEVCFFPHRHRHRAAAASSDPFSSFSLHEAVAAGWHQGLESAQIFGLETGAGTVYLAFAQRALGAVGILHVAVATAKPGTLTVNSALTHAEISPPAPFHGTGTYSAAPDGTTTWTGDLTVNFPDMPHFPLTGEQFAAEARRAL